MRLPGGALVLLLALAGAEAGADPVWETVTEEEGILVSKLSVAGRDLPTLRAEARVEATPFEILAVLNDVPRHIEWNYRCRESRLLEQKSDGEVVVYNRSAGAWPVADRDVVITSDSTVEDWGRRITVRFEATEGFVERTEGVVRMPTLDGFYLLSEVEPGVTQVVYQVDADPGGSLPVWLARGMSTEMPISTILSLRSQVEKTRGDYTGQVAAWIEETRETPPAVSAGPAAQ